MTLEEKLRNEGKREGLVEGEKRGEKRGQKMGRLEGLREAIELGITLKFPEDINTVMVKVNAIDDLETLGTIKEVIKTAKDRTEVLSLLK
jgi:hypothetical protein